MILLCAVVLTGCWNQRELSQLAMVTAIGIDKTSKGDEYRVSLQVINPSSVAGGQGDGGGGQTSAIAVYTGTGSTLTTAIHKTSQKVPRELLFTHVQLIVIGESCAKRGIQGLFDVFERYAETRLTSFVLVAKGSDAKTMISAMSPLERIPVNAIVGKMKNTEELWSENIKVTIDEVIRNLVSKGNGMVISGVTTGGTPGGKQKKSADIIKINGMALFKSSRLVRWLNGNESRGVMWVKNKMESTIYDLDCKDMKRAIAVKSLVSRTNVTVALKNEKPIFYIHALTEGMIDEVNCDIDLSDPKEIEKLEKQWGDKIKAEIMTAVAAAQKEKSDIYDFGKIINRKEPKEWRKVKNNWGQIFSESQVHVKVEALIRRTGMRINPFSFNGK